MQSPKGAPNQHLAPFHAVGPVFEALGDCLGCSFIRKPEPLAGRREHNRVADRGAAVLLALLL